MPAKIRTLIVDDEELARDRLRSLLEREPRIELIGEAGDGKRAVSAVEKLKLDLLFLDVQMHELNGFEVLQAIRSNPRTRNIPVIMVSTSERQGDIRLSYSLGANAYITKPVDYTIFMEKLRALRDFWLKSAELPDLDQE